MIIPLKILEDNYTYIITNSNFTAVVDPGLSKPVLDYLKKNYLELDFILVTHHHWDHIDGVEELVKNFPSATIYNYKNKMDLNKYNINILQTPGHTLDSCCFYLIDENALFTGDTLFTGLCGKVFEGSYEMMHRSLQSLKSISDSTIIYPGHEYLKYCLDFLKKIDCNNNFYNKISQKENPSLNSTIKDEFNNNPFMTNSQERFIYLRKLRG